VFPSRSRALDGDRERTRTDHLHESQARLGFRAVQSEDSAVPGALLLNRALEHDRPMLHFRSACNWLRQEHLARPGFNRLKRRVAATAEPPMTTHSAA
jgi:Domain of unknown function (DUF4158)